MHKNNESMWGFNTRDLMRAANCEHCVRLAVAYVLDVPGVRAIADENYVKPKGLAIDRGNAFEAELEHELVSSLPEGDVQKPKAENSVDETIALMKAGVPVIYQGALNRVFENTLFGGRPDFLVRSDYVLEFVDGQLTAHLDPEASNTGYIAWDAKLAKSAKAQYLLQVALYVDALDQLGFKGDGQAGLILGSRKLERFDENEMVPAMQLAREVIARVTIEADAAAASGNLDAFSLDNLQLFCDSLSTCDYCEYPLLCEKKRIEVDHLQQVFRINGSQIKKLNSVGITTMRALAAATDEQRPEGFVPGTYDKLRRQARLQVQTIESDTPAFELLDDPEIGVLPPPSQNDIFFDMEGFPFFEEEGGLEYLFGATNRSKVFTAFWAHSRAEEATAFADFVDFATAALASDPSAHIYHYANYEVAALGKLATRHGVREKEVFELINSGRMVDLLKVVTGSLVIGMPSYSIKKLEAYYGFARDAEVTNAMASVDEYGRYVELALAGDPEAEKVISDIARYNEEDCISTGALYDWLASLPGAHAKFEEFRKQVDIKKARAEQDGESAAGQSKQAQQAEAELEVLIAKTAHLEMALANWPWGEDEDADYRATIWQALTHSMLFYNRESVAKWREWGLLKEADEEALGRDRKALVVKGCTSVSNDGALEQSGRRVKVEYEYRMTAEQTCFLKSGDEVFVRYSVGANQHETDQGEIYSFENGVIRFSRNVLPSDINLEPDAIFERSQIGARPKPAVVGTWVQSATSRWGSPLNSAPIGHPAMDLLMRRKPRLVDNASLPEVVDENYLPAITEAVLRLDHSILAIQGPPGTGKTYLASQVIRELTDRGFSVGVTANSHPAVENLLAAIVAAGVPSTLVAKRNKDDAKDARAWTVPTSNKDVATWRTNLAGQGHVIGGTSWNFASKDFREQAFDYLFIDEAAQFSLVDALAASTGVKNIVLLGDPQQLTQVIQAIHPGGVANSALGHYMGENEILPSDFGYFVEVTRRMHPEVNRPVSWLSYQGRLHAHADAKARAIDDIRPGFAAVPVKHDGNASHSNEEAAEVLRLVELLARKIEQTEIMVVAPFNAQVSLIRQTLDASRFNEVEVGTVDKFQGREAMAVIVSLASSSADDAPRGLGFILDRNRLNVALSRAKTNSFLVYSPGLLKAGLANVEQLTSVSRLTGLLNMAKTEQEVYSPRC